MVLRRDNEGDVEMRSGSEEGYMEEERYLKAPRPCNYGGFLDPSDTRKQLNY